ncbi:MAG: transposase [Spirochaetes bacterium]|nr:transposase [Spirochaetota bacterium]
MRKPRKLKENAQYHVTARINRGEYILRESKIKDLFLQVVKRAKKKYDFNIINFCVMDNNIYPLYNFTKSRFSNGQKFSMVGFSGFLPGI